VSNALSVFNLERSISARRKLRLSVTQRRDDERIEDTIKNVYLETCSNSVNGPNIKWSVFGTTIEKN
jgi:hypothetical protein